MMFSERLTVRVTKFSGLLAVKKLGKTFELKTLINACLAENVSDILYEFFNFSF